MVRTTIEQKLKVEAKPVSFIDPKKFWTPETRKRAEEFVDIAEDVTSRCYFPGIIFGREEDIKQKVELWRKKLDELISEVKGYG